VRTTPAAAAARDKPQPAESFCPASSERSSLSPAWQSSDAGHSASPSFSLFSSPTNWLGIPASSLGREAGVFAQAPAGASESLSPTRSLRAPPGFGGARSAPERPPPFFPPPPPPPAEDIASRLWALPLGSRLAPPPLRPLPPAPPAPPAPPRQSVQIDVAAARAAAAAALQRPAPAPPRAAGL